MDSIVIGFSRPKSGFKPFSWLIRWAESTDFSHVFISLKDDYTDQDIIYQASGLAVNAITATNFNGVEQITDTFIVPVTDDEKKEITIYCENALGAPYSTKDILGFAWVFIGKLFKRQWNNPIDDGQKEYFCSKLATFILDKYTEDDVPVLPKNAMPIDVYNSLVLIKVPHVMG